MAGVVLKDLHSELGKKTLSFETAVGTYYHTLRCLLKLDWLGYLKGKQDFRKTDTCVDFQERNKH